MNVLLLTNMGEDVTQPASGAFVRRQYSALVQQYVKNGDLNLSYYEMPKRAFKFNSSIIRYFIFLSVFIKKFVFCRNTKHILHVHFFFPTIILAIFYKLFRNYKVKIVVTFHGSDIYHYQNFNWWYRWCFSFVNYSFFVSQHLKDKFFKKHIPHSILCAGILPVYKYLDCVKKYNMIFVGALDHNKGVDKFIQLLKMQKQEGRSVVVGSGINDNKIKELASQGVIDYFPYCEPEQLAFLYQQSSWLINLSCNESFGLVIAEAMACGIPAIATETDGALSQITNKNNGFIIKQKKNLLDNICDVLDNTTEIEYSMMAKNAQEYGNKVKLINVISEIMSVYIKVSK